MADEQTQTQGPPIIDPPSPPAGAAPPPPPPPGNPESQARLWCMICHLSALCAYVGIPFGNILGPLIVWQIKKNEIPAVDAHGKAAMNFQITMTIVIIASIFPVFCVNIFAIPLILIVAAAAIILPIIAGIKANNGEEFKYPFSFEFVK